ncbi:hypothetical protein chiPu_0020640 [Chiloscyllium punctatum]|uniref:Ig-like domain-containing protein n=1 Tax=Chiloscyllium punctatum TaxID=137246 RepID=A0A401RI02_CHIPU|nr:hypothetical protein [Chiloscyllium punctatum]
MSEPASEPQAGVWLTVLLLSLMLDGGLFSELYFVEEPSDVIAVRDRALMLNCQVEGVEPITITWRKDGLPLQGRGRISVLHNGSLCICNFLKKKENNESDVGEYDCTARNRFGILLSRKARVQVATLPRFQTHPQSMKVQLGGVARFECHIFGIPEAKITWELNRVPLNMEDASENIKLTHSNSTLIINHITPSDEAIYQCIAKNSAGTNQASARLAVALSQELPEPPDDVWAEAVSRNAIRLSWKEPAHSVTEEIIGYVLHIRRAAEPSALYEIKMSAFNQHGDGNSTERYVSLRENTELPAPQTPPCDCKASTESPLTGIVVGIHIGMACIIFCVLILMLGYQRSLFGCKGIKESWTVPQAGHSLSQEGQNGHVELDKKDEAGRVMEMTEFVSGKFQNGDAVSENGHDRECSSSQLQVVIEQHPTGPKP